jgi:DNA processing protein
MNRDERRAWLRLALTPGIGPAMARQLLGAFGLPPAIFASGYAALARVVGDAVARALCEAETATMAQALARAESWLQSEPGASIMCLADGDYPASLLQLHDPPALLYLVGRRELMGRPSLAIVGSRSATRQGQSNAESFASHLAHCGLTIVSGMARGIDAAAHQGALGTEACTIAVLGTGADIVYPASGKALAAQIRAGGLIVSEFPLGAPALPDHFPRRNRLIAGLSRGVLVVEAALHSGSLITARLAAELGRDVLAIPGSIHSPVARGCHRLIRDGARLVETTHDVLTELRFEAGAAAATNAAMNTAAAAAPATTAAAQGAAGGGDTVLHAMGHDPVNIDTLAGRTGLAPGRLSARLLELELTQHVERLAGNTYQRLRRA